MGVIRKFISAFQCWKKYTQSIQTNIKTNHREFYYLIECSMQLDFSLFSQFSEKTEAYISYLYAVQCGVLQYGVIWCTSVLQDVVWSGVGQC